MKQSAILLLLPILMEVNSKNKEFATLGANSLLLGLIVKAHFFHLQIKKEGQPKGHHLYNLGRTEVSSDKYQVSRQSVNWFWRRFLKVFTIYGHGGHLDHETQIPGISFCSLCIYRLHMKSGFNRPSGFRVEVV